MPALYDYQRVGADLISRNQSYIIADPPGLGKTAQAIVGLRSMPSMMVVCPSSVKENWADEIRIWRPEMEPHVILLFIPSATLCLLIGAFNPLTFKVIIDR